MRLRTVRFGTAQNCVCVRVNHEIGELVSADLQFVAEFHEMAAFQIQLCQLRTLYTLPQHTSSYTHNTTKHHQCSPTYLSPLHIHAYTSMHICTLDYIHNNTPTTQVVLGLREQIHSKLTRSLRVSGTEAKGLEIVYLLKHLTLHQSPPRHARLGLCTVSRNTLK